MLPSGRSSVSVGNSSKMSTTTGGLSGRAPPPPPPQAADREGGQRGREHGPCTHAGKCKRRCRSGASQEAQRPAAGHLEHLDQVAPVVERGLREPSASSARAGRRRGGSSGPRPRSGRSPPRPASRRAPRRPPVRSPAIWAGTTPGARAARAGARAAPAIVRAHGGRRPRAPARRRSGRAGRGAGRCRCRGRCAPEPNSRSRRRTTWRRRASQRRAGDPHHRAEVARVEAHRAAPARRAAERRARRRPGSRAARPARRRSWASRRACARSASLTRPRRWPGRLHDQRHRRELLDVRRAHRPARVHPGLPGDAVVGRHHDQACRRTSPAPSAAGAGGRSGGPRTRAGAGSAARCGA